MCCRGEVSGGSDRITHGTLRDRVALDQRLREAARAELLADADRGPVATAADGLGAIVIADLARGGGADTP